MKNRDFAAKTAFRYLLGAVAVLIFGFGYECFSHQVYSNWMVYAFAFPLLLGTLPYLWFATKKAAFAVSETARLLWFLCICTFTAGSLAQGILTIYGTTNTLTQGFWWAGSALAAFALVSQLLFLRKNP